MGSFTLELRRLYESPNIQIFGFDYDFYTDDKEIKKNFEKKFIDYYYFDQIGFETVGKFKHRLRTKLNTIMPIIKKRYETELASKDINFLLNKDLTETTSRSLDKEDTTNNTNNANSKNINDSTANENTNFKESSLNNGNARLGMDRLTTINENSSSMNNTVNASSNSQSNFNGQTRGNENETITFKSQGNIGVTSSAELLEKWRSVIIDVDMEIIKECRDLFMGVY